MKFSLRENLLNFDPYGSKLGDFGLKIRLTPNFLGRPKSGKFRPEILLRKISRSAGIWVILPLTGQNVGNFRCRENFTENFLQKIFREKFFCRKIFLEKFSSKIFRGKIFAIAKIFN